MKVSALAFLLAAVPALADQDYDLSCPSSLADGSGKSQKDFFEEYMFHGCSVGADCTGHEDISYGSSVQTKCTNCPDGLASDLVKGCTIVPSYRHIP